MSEYQYYEFQALDRPLSEQEQAAVRRFSSRAEVRATQATFTYNYGDFPGDARQLLAQYFDAMLYVSNFGDLQLVFRFPKHLIDLEQIQPYCINQSISCQTEGAHTILDIEICEEQGHDWIDGEGWLSSLAPLRHDILQGDYRLLYLAWLRAVKIEKIARSSLEPPVPPGLQTLSRPLRRFVKLFKVDKTLLKIAAQASRPAEIISTANFRQAIAALSREECDDFLLRLVQEDPHLAVALKRKLAAQPKAAGSETAVARTVGQLLQSAREKRKQRQKKKAEAAEARRIRELEELSRRESETWQSVDDLIQKSNARAYQEAVRLLLKLRDLAIHQGREAAFDKRLIEIEGTYSRRHALLRRIRQAGLSQF